MLPRVVQIVGVVPDENSSNGDLYGVINFLIAFGDEIYPFTMLVTDRIQLHSGSSTFGVMDERLVSTVTTHHNDATGPFNLMYTAANVTVSIKPQ